MKLHGEISPPTSPLREEPSPHNSTTSSSLHEPPPSEGDDEVDES